MKALRLGLIALLVAISSGAAHSQTAWLLVSRTNQFAVVRTGQSVRDIVTIRDAMPNYGESRRAVVIVAKGTADDGSVFYIDSATGAVVRLLQKDGSSTSWQLPPGQGDSARILSIGSSSRARVSGSEVGASGLFGCVKRALKPRPSRRSMCAPIEVRGRTHRLDTSRSVSIASAYDP